MQVRSRSHSSDMAVARFDGEVHDRGDYVVVRTDANPSFFWGNFLVFPRAPMAGDAERWLAVHEREFPPAPGRATILSWDELDGRLGDDADFLAQGFHRDLGVCLRATRLHKGPKHNADVSVRALASDADWTAATAALIAAFADGTRAPVETQRAFVVKQMRRYRAMQDAGWGRWFGAFIGPRAAGCAGLVQQGQVGRFQLVGTDPAFARNGVCSTLLHEMGAQSVADELIIVAGAEYHARAVYESVGFEVCETLATLMKIPT
ncbi:MAG: GNAT family N-acetyltransferase [Deltaproteobacteria bacterium]|nr:GNAT family N-acetyltransferase [Deltaproteobacteria bacterium]